MNLLAFVLAAAIFFSLGLVLGGVMFAVGTARHLVDIYVVTNCEGHTYLLDDVYEVDMALKVDGMLAVQRLRVLT